MEMNETTYRVEINDRARRIRESWGTRRQQRKVAAARRWQGPLRGANEMR
ncbi:hypothetical protein [Nocardioides daphniae]|uniref:Uncharacterized protein n=1 Tax=Nocardioides daphniae TaxID=402297 RepID=A0ABQ1PZW0_9ACTN|nr:hypothetical protein GCM10007231_03900 [Nocardioides daphniae]